MLVTILLIGFVAFMIDNMKSHILIIDDDSRMLMLLKKFFEKNNFLVSIAINVKQAQKYLEYFIYDLIVLDVMLPQISGIEFAKMLKSSDNKNMPIIMLTALSESYNCIEGLEAGADDYLTKPFESRELLLRVHNLIVMHNKNKKQQYIKRFGNNHYNCNTKQLMNKGNVIKLTDTEQKLLELLLNNEGQVFSRRKLSDQLSDKNIVIRSVDVYITRIRNKIEDNPKHPKYLKTIRNAGYAIYT